MQLYTDKQLDYNIIKREIESNCDEEARLTFEFNRKISSLMKRRRELNKQLEDCVNRED